MFSSDMIPQFKVDATKAVELGYSTITQENIDAAIAKAVPLQQMQAEVSQADMQAMQQINAAGMGMMQQGINQQMNQQMMQQQMMQQQMMQPQRPGLGGATGGFGASSEALLVCLPLNPKWDTSNNYRPNIEAV